MEPKHPVSIIISPEPPILIALPPLITSPSFATTFVWVELAPVDGVEQLAVPQVQPLGQHAPPRLAAHVDQPFAQLPLAVIVALGTSGTTIV